MSNPNAIIQLYEELNPFSNSHKDIDIHSPPHLYTLLAHKRFQGIAPSKGGSMLKEKKKPARTRPLVRGISTTVPWAGGMFQLFIALFL